jgi:hypothetical protein
MENNEIQIMTNNPREFPPSINLQNIIKKQNYRKLLMISIFFTLWMIFKIGFSFLGPDEGVSNQSYCFQDKLLTEVLLPVTNYLSQNMTVRDSMLIFASSMLDIGLVTFGIIYIFKGFSWVYPLSFLLFYGIRSILQAIFTMQFFDTFIFENPGFISIVVPYFRTPDFFFSGHIGCTLILSLSFRDWGYRAFSYYYIFVMILEAFVMTTTRAHYSIDIIFGFITGHYLFITSKYISVFLDKHLPLCGKKKEIKK